MEILFIITLGSIIVLNGTLIVYFIGNAYILPQFFPQFQQVTFGESLLFVLLGIFLFVTLFGNRITQKKKRQNIQSTKNPATLHYGEKSL